MIQVAREIRAERGYLGAGSDTSVQEVAAGLAARKMGIEVQQLGRRQLPGAITGNLLVREMRKRLHAVIQIEAEFRPILLT